MVSSSNLGHPAMNANTALLESYLPLRPRIRSFASSMNSFRSIYCVTMAFAAVLIQSCGEEPSTTPVRPKSYLYAARLGESESGIDIIDCETDSVVSILVDTMHSGNAAIIASPDARFLLVMEQGKSSLWNLESVTPVTLPIALQSAEFLPDRGALLGITHDKVFVLSLTDGSVLREFDGVIFRQPRHIHGSSLSVGRSLARDTLYLLDCDSGLLTDTITLGPISPYGHVELLHCWAVSPDGRLVYAGVSMSDSAGNKSQLAVCYDLQLRQLRFVIESGAALACDASPDGREVWYAELGWGNSGSVLVCDAATGRVITRIQTESFGPFPADDIEFCPDLNKTYLLAIQRLLPEGIPFEPAILVVPHHEYEVRAALRPADPSAFYTSMAIVRK